MIGMRSVSSEKALGFTWIYHGRLKGMDGNVVDCDACENIRAVSGAGTVSTHVVLEDKFPQAAAKLKCNEACGPDLVPPEFRKCICSSNNNTSRTWATQLCNFIWCHGDIFEAMICSKQGNPSGYDSCKPISLLSIGYKLFATVLLQMLYRQLMLLKKVADQPSGHFMRNCVFEESSNSLKKLREAMLERWCIQGCSGSCWGPCCFRCIVVTPIF